MEFLFDVKWNDACPFLKRVVESYLFERERSSFYNTLDSLYGCGKCKRNNHHQCLIYLKTKFPHLYKTYHLTICPQHRYHYSLLYSKKQLFSQVTTISSNTTSAFKILF